MVKLHLGCGERYLKGYINIDLPDHEHTIQKNKADKFYDITKLKYPLNSVEEIRLHHVFEHFTRPIACGLLASWNSWLEMGGILHLEVPDIKETFKRALLFRKSKTIYTAIRHLYGSHEAEWAIHREGYTRKVLKHMLECFGFKIRKVLKNHWKGTYNIELISVKVKSFSIDESIDNCKKYLYNFLIDETELDLLNVWIIEFKKQLNKTGAKGWR